MFKPQHLARLGHGLEFGIGGQSLGGIPQLGRTMENFALDAACKIPHLAVGMLINGQAKVIERFRPYYHSAFN